MVLHERVRILLETQANLAASQKTPQTKAPDCPCGHPKENHLWGSGACLCRTEGTAYCKCQGYNQKPVSDSWPCGCTQTEDIRDTRDPNSEMMTKFTKNELLRLRQQRAAEVEVFTFTENGKSE